MPPGPRVLLVVYAVAIEAIVWLALVPAWCVRAFRRREPLGALRQKLGWFRPVPASVPATRHVFIHAVSVGEMHSAEPLVAELAATGQSVWLTTGTSAGLDAATRIAALHPGVAGVSFLPWDRHAVRRWLRDAAPAAMIVVETEIWPHLYLACREASVPLFVVSGRIRPQDVWKYRRLRSFFRPVLEIPAWIGAQSEADREAFIAIGAPAARVCVAGSLKFDAALRPVPAAARLNIAGAQRPLLVAGSTHAPEEKIVLEAARALLRDGCPIRVVLAPRQLARVDAVVRLAQRQGFVTWRWSDGPPQPDGAWDVAVLDRYNILRDCYSAADVVVLGGTLAPIGGHNILEPAASARPILVGPHVDGIAAAVDSFEAAGALWRLTATSPSRSLANACRALIDDPARARAMGRAARRCCEQGAGSASRCVRAMATIPRRASDARRSTGTMGSDRHVGQHDGGQQHAAGRT